MSDLNPSEWNFSALSPEEYAACVRYELAREIQDWQSYFDQEVDYSDVRSSSDLNIVYLNTSFLFPRLEFPVREQVFNAIWPGYFPGTPWLDIPQEERIKTAHRYTGQHRAINSRVDAKWTPNGPEGIVDGHGFQTLPFCIDWKQSDWTILDDLRQWLETNRPSQIAVETERGRQSLGDDLKAISAMRLRHHYSAADAAKLSHSMLGKPLYSESFAWDRAATRGVELFKATFPEAGEPKSAVRKPAPRGRPPK